MHKEADRQNFLHPAETSKKEKDHHVGPITRKEIEEVKKLFNKLNKNALWKFLQKKGK